jgi:hypothetical protein
LKVNAAQIENLRFLKCSLFDILQCLIVLEIRP